MITLMDPEMKIHFIGATAKSKQSVAMVGNTTKANVGT